MQIRFCAVIVNNNYTISLKKAQYEATILNQVFLFVNRVNNSDSDWRWVEYL